MALTNKMNKLLTIVCDNFNPGKISYLRSAHKRSVIQGLNDEHFNRMSGYLRDTLLELKQEESVVNEIIDIVESIRPIILNR